MANKRIFLSPPFAARVERQRIAEAFASNYLAPCGPMVDRFEGDFSRCVGQPHAVALSSATAALDLLFEELGVARGDTVFCSDLTFIASIGPAFRRGASPVFIDCDTASWTMDPDLLGEALHDAARRNRLPRAVVAVDLYGQCCDYDRISNLCAAYGVPLIDDAAEALGATYRGRPSGSAGIAGVFSFNGNKMITASGGGMLVTADRGIAERARWRSQQCREAAAWYQHTSVGTNCRMSSLCAALGDGQLARLPEILRRKQALARSYRRALPDFTWMPEADYGACTHWLNVALVPGAKTPRRHDRPCARVERLRRALEAENIESRPIWKPMHLQPVFAGCKTYGGAVCEDLFARGICLPSGAGLAKSELERVLAVASTF